MPFITVEVLEGRSDDQLQAFAEAVTQAAVEHLEAERTRVRIRFVDIPRNRLARGGSLIAKLHEVHPD